MQPARPAHPHHVGAQVGKHHPRVWPRSDAAELDHPHPGQGTRAGHGRLLTLLHLQHPLAQFLGRGIHGPLDGALEHEAGQRNIRVDG